MVKCRTSTYNIICSLGTVFHSAKSTISFKTGVFFSVVSLFTVLQRLQKQKKCLCIFFILKTPEIYIMQRKQCSKKIIRYYLWNIEDKSKYWYAGHCFSFFDMWCAGRTELLTEIHSLNIIWLQITNYLKVKKYEV